MKWLVSIFKRFKQALVTLLFMLVILGGAGGTWLFLHHTHNPDSQRQAVLTKVGKLAILPGNETPALANVVDKTKLQANGVLREAENGDLVLIYTQNARIIIYRPSDNKIVDMGPLVTGTQGSIYITSRFTILDGSGGASSFGKISQAISAAFPNARITNAGTAPRTFPQTILIDPSGNNPSLTQQLADTLKIHTGLVPTGVKVPTGADFLLIIGTDQ